MMMAFADWLTGASNYVHTMMLIALTDLRPNRHSIRLCLPLWQVRTKDDHERYAIGLAGGQPDCFECSNYAHRQWVCR